MVVEETLWYNMVIEYRAVGDNERGYSVGLISRVAWMRRGRSRYCGLCASYYSRMHDIDNKCNVI